ncbi:MAG: helix-turn-helix domain-containing protein [Actinomycetota bacterium]
MEDALWWARWQVQSRWRETNEFGRAGEYANDSEIAVITNRNTSYRWIVRRGDHRVEFQTPEMLEGTVADQSVELHLTVEEVEALARATVDAKPKDRRQKALVEQALDQIAVVCRQVRARVEAGDELIDSWTRAIPRRPPDEPPSPEPEQPEEPARERPRYRPLGDPDNLSLKEAGEILGRKRNTVYLWFKQGKFPPAVDVASHLGRGTKPVIVVPRYRLEAWQAGERMPPILQEVFETRGLLEAPWACFVTRRRARREDIEFWVDRRGLKLAASTTGRKIFGTDLEEGRVYELRELLESG